MASGSVAPFAFHCIICYEAFDVEDRPPVVLPCGHTYICAPCAGRLKRCMECRSNLFITAPTPAQQSPLPLGLNRRPPPHLPSMSRYGSRVGGPYNISPQKPPPTPAEQIPLPLPKNLTMISLMEAAQRKAAAAKVGAVRQPALTAKDLHGGEEDDDDNDDDEEEDDEEKMYESGDDDEDVLQGMEALMSSAGTYAVTEKAGLAVLQHHPSSLWHGGKGQNQFGGSECTSLCEEPLRVFLGQTVQVVDIADGVFKLARDTGYIQASTSQLVKVGAPLDAACQAEGLLCSVAARKREYERKLEEFKELEIGLVSNLHEVLNHSEEHHPVISPPPQMESRHDGDDEDEGDEDTKENREVKDAHHEIEIGTTSPANQETTSRVASPPQSPARVDHSPQPTILPFAARFPFTIDNSEIGQNADTGVVSTEQPTETISCVGNGGDSSPNLLACGMFSDRYGGDTGDQDNDGESIAALSFDSAIESVVETLDLSRRTTNGVEVENGLEVRRTFRRTTGRSAAAGNVEFLAHPLAEGNKSGAATFESINFRTGLSGHRALMSSSANRTSGAAAQTARSQLRLMGEHRGISKIRPIRRLPPGERETGSPGASPSQPANNRTVGAVGLGFRLPKYIIPDHCISASGDY